MTLQQIAVYLLQDQVVAYPTEAVFGLGCNPLSESAVKKLLDLKQRPVEKGLILIAPTLDFLLPFIDICGLNDTQLARLKAHYDRPITWVVPAKSNVPAFLTGKFNRIAVRLTDHPAVQGLCEATGFALTSTSANLTGAPPCRTAEEVRLQFGEDFPVLDLAVGKAKNPSEIRDLITNQLFRQG
ncbi:Sua5/YciO/YrdC/YwlC family protein [Rodentibacter pneumotropicus]|uniref:Threonylcarbamoyl-AMP synthase n=1 Tax=Rodentibacter pneumotropicus TaxID=758 RepID=A0A448MJF8_9PAST|nr:Sua5/YciO/YrdC/YwlC family protein [Rodentibacter pneumotropicus]MDC2826208.1 Sua5/YciO/YrdC/YwlC family protein [Rodentibacter pneumotropicus]NBH75858.1 tRNA threonylcarbamoyladenosine biosynthesis protein RimN [Rodentibacter pneumotropicus]OOF62954.1 tRNA threonylcarbamoyladenosine biosynthesis protein RimN [Rodentibacter pneumotropicus]THA07571.1 tRNA threonylcarbamoyladenosine biosynthesis protein RimN [Rodentibacter pneumotropicus]THA11440.1 tRNA threonylcarbamoyladenosine biosynthesis